MAVPEGIRDEGAGEHKQPRQGLMLLQFVCSMFATRLLWGIWEVVCAWFGGNVYVCARRAAGYGTADTRQSTRHVTWHLHAQC